MLNALFRNNGWVISVGKGLGSVLFPCPIAGQFLRNAQSGNGINWSGCGNYGYNDTSLAYYDVYTDGNCGEYSTLTGSWHRPAGDVLYNTGCCQVIWDGSYYYVNDNCNPCGQANTETGNTRVVNVSEIYWEGCNSSGYFSTSYDTEIEYHDGYCGTFWEYFNTVWAEDGATIYNYNNCCYVYYDISDYPYYYVQDNCSGNCEDPYLHDGEDHWWYDGCNWWYTPPCTDAGPTGNVRDVDHQYVYWSGCGNDGQFLITYNTEEEYHDGACGYYWSWVSTWNAMNGDVIYDSGCCQVVYDSVMGYNVNDNCGNPCTSSGTPTGASNLIYEYTMLWYGCGTSGNFVYENEISYEYHDGACGFYWDTVRWWAQDGGVTVIYDNGCCQVIYNSPDNYSVFDNCTEPPPPCPEASTPTGNTSTGSYSNLNWDGCGTSGEFAYSYSGNSTEYHDGNCSTYWVTDSSWEANSGEMIYDGGCCTVTYSQYGSYSVNDNCGEPPPPDYPSAGTVLFSSSSPVTQDITVDGYDMEGSFQSVFASVNIANTWSNEIADGFGGSTFESGTDYVLDGSTVYDPSIGAIRLLDWYLTDGGGSYSGQLQVGLDVTPWVMSGQGAIPSGTSFLDKFSEGYIIFESNEFWNGDANVKTRVEYQNGGGYITTTITF
jgi:hypothetical protein